MSVIRFVVLMVMAVLGCLAVAIGSYESAYLFALIVLINAADCICDSIERRA